MEAEIAVQCPFCAKPVPAESYFCPFCGKKIREKELSTSFLSQSGIYLLSFFAPPFGFWPGIRYIRQKDMTRKTIGIVAIVLTIISLVLTIALSGKLLNMMDTILNSQLQEYPF